MINFTFGLLGTCAFVLACSESARALNVEKYTRTATEIINEDSSEIDPFLLRCMISGLIFRSCSSSQIGNIVGAKIMYIKGNHGKRNEAGMG